MHDDDHNDHDDRGGGGGNSRKHGCTCHRYCKRQLSLLAFVVLVCSCAIPIFNQTIRYYDDSSSIEAIRTRSGIVNGEMKTKNIQRKPLHRLASMDNTNNNTIWVVGRTWSEGLSGWMVSFAKAMVLAKRLNAIIVEPGIKDARLTTAEKGNVMLSSIFNCTILQEYFHQGGRQQQQRHLATLNQYKHALEQKRKEGNGDSNNVVIFNLCLQKNKLKYCQFSSAVTGSGEQHQQKIPTEIGKKQSWTLNSVIEAATNPTVQNRMIILYLHNVWINSLDTFEIPTSASSTNSTTAQSSWRSWHGFRGSFQSSSDVNNVNNKILIPTSEVDYVTSRYFQFTDTIQKLADDAISRLLSQDESKRINNGSNDNNFLFHHQRNSGRPSLGFGVIHWRAELERLDYLHCAHGLIRARDIMMQYAQQQQQQDQEYQELPVTETEVSSLNESASAALAGSSESPMMFILMSSLSLDESIEWNGARKHSSNTTAREALELLLGNSQHEGNKYAKFLKLENVFPSSTQGSTTFPDKVYYPVLDLIVAQRATFFATCTKSCHRKYNGKGYSVGSKKIPKGLGYCTACNYVGKFAELALRLRRDHADQERYEDVKGIAVEKKDWSCWPT